MVFEIAYRPWLRLSGARMREEFPVFIVHRSSFIVHRSSFPPLRLCVSVVHHVH